MLCATLSLPSDCRCVSVNKRECTRSSRGTSSIHVFSRDVIKSLGINLHFDAAEEDQCMCFTAVLKTDVLVNIREFVPFLFDELIKYSNMKYKMN